MLHGDRKALAAAITLVESQRAQDAPQAEALLADLLPHAGKAVRVGVTGAPGVGKSTLIEALGCRLCDQGHKVAVLAVDPSSQRTGGSILGDKTRMARLSQHERAFVRPSPGGGALGGVAHKTREAMVACEAAGFDIVLVETIGTGQSEVEVASMVDYFLLLLSPAAGDELQGIKRGVMELCSGVVVNKADGPLREAAERAAQQCRLALHILRAEDEPKPEVLVVSAQEDRGMDAVWERIEQRIAQDRASSAFAERRRRQAKAWMDRTVLDSLQDAFLQDPRVQQAMPELAQSVENGTLLPAAAARALLRLYRGD